MQSTNDILSTFDKVFNPEASEQLARKCQFIHRSSSKLKGHEFIKALCIPDETTFCDSLSGICLRIKVFNPEADVTASALVQRINTRSAVLLMKATFEKLIQLSREKIKAFSTDTQGLLAPFNKVYIEDSTLCSLHERLSSKFKGTGRGNTVSTSQLKINLTHEFKSGLIVDAEPYSGNIPDQSLAELILKLIESDDLVLRDQGYFSLSAFKDIDTKRAFYISRLPPQYIVSLNSERIELGKYLQENYQNQQCFDLFVEIGEVRLPVRLVGYRKPQHVIEKALREAHRRARETGRTLSESKKTLLAFTIFITNAPEKLISKATLGTIYRLRWEIELIFKRWKGLLHVHYLKGTNPYRIDCLIWSRLCTAILVAMMTSQFMNLAQELLLRELSPVKFINYLLRQGKFFHSLAKNTLSELIEEILVDMKGRLLKDKRSRLSAKKRIDTCQNFYGWNIHASEDEYVKKLA